MSEAEDRARFEDRKAKFGADLSEYARMCELAGKPCDANAFNSGWLAYEARAAQAASPVAEPEGALLACIRAGMAKDKQIRDLEKKLAKLKVPVAEQPTPTMEPTIECGEGDYKPLLRLDVPGNLKQLVIEFLKWDGGEGSRAYDAQKYRILRDALRKLAAAPSVAEESQPTISPDAGALKASASSTLTEQNGAAKLQPPHSSQAEDWIRKAAEEIRQSFYVKRGYGNVAHQMLLTDAELSEIIAKHYARRAEGQ